MQPFRNDSRNNNSKGFDNSQMDMGGGGGEAYEWGKVS